MSATRILIYLIRRDLRVSDNPILHHLATSSDHGFTHLLPVFVVPAQQMEVSGFLKDGAKSPYPEARSALAGFWRTGPHRTKFISQAVWNLKENLEKLGSSLTIRVGSHGDALKGLIEHLDQKQLKVGAVWMTGEEGYEEIHDEKAVATTCAQADIDFRVWVDEKYFVDDRDLKLDTPQSLPDVYTTYRKMMEPLREKPRLPVPAPSAGSLPHPVDPSDMPDQPGPFTIPNSYEGFEGVLLRPLEDAFPNVPPFPDGAKSAHPFEGGEDHARQRLNDLIMASHVNTYKSTRNGLLGANFSTKLSAYLAQGCITARQVHAALLAFENGSDESFAAVEGYGDGENEGTATIRFELLWRDYMRLCTRKFKAKLFRRSGFREEYNNKWKSPKREDAADNQQQSAEETAKILERVLVGTTGMGLIDASQRELAYTGYTSNRARQNVASFLAKHLDIDWRYGAEWYEMCLVDYDVSSNWANWQYVSGVGNDPRGEARIFNPVKQAFDYDKDGEYVRTWVPEVRPLEKLENVFQAWTTPQEDWDRLGLTGLVMVEDPVKKIAFSVEGKPRNPRRSFPRRRGQDRGGPGGPNNQRAPGPTRLNGEKQIQIGANGMYAQYNGPGNAHGGFRGGRGGAGGGYRGRGGGYGGGRGTFHNGRGGQWQNGYSHAQRPMQPSWSTANTPQ